MMLIISRLPVLPHKHPHELLDSVVKEQLVKLFASTEAAHSTAALFSVKLFFEFISGETLFYSTTCTFDQNFFSPAGGAFYSVQNRCQPPLSTAFEPFDRSTDRIKPPPCRPARILHARPSFASLHSLNLLINKKFLKRFIAEVARILPPAECASSFNCSFVTRP
ncbi:hypothetical protein ACRS3X_16890 [Ectopseudomonas hydrolytica]|uniref:hypothetical protein n=1 Tax=Ectopseudomonas hydrolytica TaxID=2493633 RepID=UPI003EE34AD2